MLQTFSAPGLAGRQSAMTDLLVKEYGSGLKTVIVLHDGPGAASGLAPLARELSRRWHVLEPFQRASGGRLLTVAEHLEDLGVLIRARCGHHRPVLVGHSGGAELALAYATENPTVPAAVVLIGCGSFSREADADLQLAAIGRLVTRAFGHDTGDVEEGGADGDALAHEEAWTDKLHLDRNGGYPVASSAIRVPVLMLHGAVDPHPGRRISEHLRRCIPDLEYLELPKCGHTPWLAAQEKQIFFDTLQAWLEARCERSPSM